MGSLVAVFLVFFILVQVVGLGIVGCVGIVCLHHGIVDVVIVFFRVDVVIFFLSYLFVQCQLFLLDLSTLFLFCQLFDG